MILTNNKIIALTLLFSLSLNVSSVSVELSHSGQASNDLDESTNNNNNYYTFRAKCIRDLEEMLYDFNKGILDAFLHGLLRLNNVPTAEARNHYGVTYYLELFVNSEITCQDFVSGIQYFGHYDENITQMLFNAGLWNNPPEIIIKNLYFGYRSLNFIGQYSNPLLRYANLIAERITSITPLIGHVLYSPREYCDRNLPIAPVTIPYILYLMQG